MLIFAFILICIIFVDIQSAGKNEFYSDYCSPKQTTSINGIFVMLIFISHIAQRLLKIPDGPMTDMLSSPYVTFRTYIGQLVVVTFLFYSGYGITESIKKKGIQYVKDIPSKGLFKVWYHLAIAVTLYVIWNLIFDKKYSITTIMLAYTGWENIGGSNWYIFVTLVMYLLIFISFMLFRKSKFAAVTLTALLSVALILFERKMGQGSYYYNTVMVFPIGMFFSLIKPHFDKIFLKNDIIWVLGLGFVFGICCYLGTVRNDSLIYYELWAIFAAILVIFITMKVKIQNSILDWFGHHVFSIYVLQYIPMNTFAHFGIDKSHPYAFFILCFVSTIVIAIIFDAAMEKTDSLIYNRKKAKNVSTKQNNTINAQPSTTEIKA